MAANDLVIRISAIDKATAVVRQVNDSISKSLRPVMNVQRSLKMLAREAGLERMGKSLVDVSRAAADVATKVGSILAPLTAVLGIGSIAAIGMLAKKFGEFGSEILRSSATLGISTRDLQAYRGAAEMAGVSSETFTGNMKAFGDTLQDATHGRNAGAAYMLKQLGINVKKSADGVIDTSNAYGALADRIASIKDPHVQALIARTFGVEESLPLLRNGAAAIDALAEEYTRTVGIMEGPALDAADRYHKSMTRMGQTVEMVKNTIGNALLPILQPMVERVSKWAAANQHLIATRVAEFVDGLARAVQSIDWNAVVAGIESFVDGIRSAVQWVGGWKTALVIVAAVMAGPLLASVFGLAAAMINLGVAAAPVVGLMGVGLVRAASAAMLQMGLMTATTLPRLSAAFVSAGAFLETGLLAKIGALAGGVGLGTAALAAGYAIGTAIYKGIEDTKLGDKIGRFVTVTLAALGNKEAQATLEAELNAKAGLGGPAPGKRATPPAAAPAAPTALAKVQAEADIQKLMGMGWTRAQATGIAANIQRESGGNEKAVGDKGQAFGLAQWHPDRQAAFQQWAGKNIRESNRDEQLAFINYELRHGEKGAGDALSRARDAGQAAVIMSQQYERPADAAGEAAKRAALAVALAQPGPAVPTPYTPFPAGAGGQQTTASGAAPAAGQQGGVVTVQIAFENAPAGMKSRVETKGPVVANTRIAFAMPGVGV
jgi:hypothetical protein